MSYKSRAYLKFALCAILLLLLVPDMWRRSGTADEEEGDDESFRGKDIRCAVTLGGGLKESYQFGLSYELLTSFASDHQCNVKISTLSDRTDFVDSLKEGVFDIVVIREKIDTGDFSGMGMSVGFDDTHRWLINSGEDTRLKEINHWLSTTAKTSEDYESLVKLFSSAYNPHKKASAGFHSKVLSPYDSIIKKYAKEIGWDWRMLTALIYAESKFTINNESKRGAIGLMQVMPRTGKKYGATNLMDPEQNIRVGVQFLQRLERQFSQMEMSPDQRIKFTLAAYNAGEGRIAQCRAHAASKGGDATNWESVVSYLPFDGFDGRETTAYVRSVTSLYNAFCTICPDTSNSRAVSVPDQPSI